MCDLFAKFENCNTYRRKTLCEFWWTWPFRSSAFLMKWILESSQSGHIQQRDNQEKYFFKWNFIGVIYRDYDIFSRRFLNSSLGRDDRNSL